MMDPLGTRQRGLSRADVERFCMLTAIGDGCTCDELAGRLGLSPLLVKAVHTGVLTLKQEGLVDEMGAIIQVTERGREWKQLFDGQSRG